MAVIKATTQFGDGKYKDSAGDMLDIFKPAENTVRPAWWENPVALAKRRVRELQHGKETSVNCGAFTVEIRRSASEMHLYIVMRDGAHVLETRKKPDGAAEEIATWIDSQLEPKEENPEMPSTPSPKAIELMQLLQAKGAVALDVEAWGGQMLGALKRMKYVTEDNGFYSLTEKGAERLVEVASQIQPRKDKADRPRRVIHEFDSAKSDEWVQRRTKTEARHDEQLAAAPADEVNDLAERLTDSLEAATGETVQAVEIHVTDSVGGGERFAIPVLTRMAEAVQADAPVQANSYTRIDISLERPLDEARLFELYPDLGAMVAAIRAAGARVEVCARVNTDVRGYQHE